MCSSLTYEAFSAATQSKFRVSVEGADTVALQLIAVSPAERSERHEQFSIEFLGPNEPFLGQGTRRFDHDQMGGFDLFIVPVGHDPQGYRYEAVFNRLR